MSSKTVSSGSNGAPVPALSLRADLPAECRLRDPKPLGTSSKAKDPPLQQALQVVDSLRSVGDFRTALGRLYELSEEHPESVEVLWRYAILWSDYGKAADREPQAQAAENLQRAIELESRTHNHLELGKVHLKMKRTDAAREQLQIALDVAPADPFAPQYKLEARALLNDMS